MHALPTTPGSIVTFDIPDGDNGTLRAVATLIPGHIDDDGAVHDAVWAGAELNSPDDEGSVFSEEFILGARPEVYLVTELATGEPESIREYGTVIQVTGEGWDCPMTYTFAPSWLADGEPAESFWTNSYGGYWTQNLDHDVRVLYTAVSPGEARA
jgi:hypothetical protein